MKRQFSILVIDENNHVTVNDFIIEEGSTFTIQGEKVISFFIYNKWRNNKTAIVIIREQNTWSLWKIGKNYTGFYYVEINNRKYQLIRLMKKDIFLNQILPYLDDKS